MSIIIHIEPAWRERLARAGLRDWPDFIACQAGECLSAHARSQINRIELPDGQAVFLKIDHFTKFKTSLYALAHARMPQPNTGHEREIYRQLRADGFCVPEVIAWGAERRWGLPHRGFMVTLPLDGIPLDRFVLQEGWERGNAAISAARATLERLQALGYDWNRDCKPEHFFVLNEGGIGLIDLERAEKRRRVSPAQRTRQLHRFITLLPNVCFDIPPPPDAAGKSGNS